MKNCSIIHEIGEILPTMNQSLWDIANTPIDETRKPRAQRDALRLLLNIRGGIAYVSSRPPEELFELARRGIWGGPLILKELAGLEIERRRRVMEIADIDRLRGQILRDLRIIGSTKNKAG